MSDSLDSDQAGQFVWPDLVPSCLLTFTFKIQKSPLVNAEGENAQSLIIRGIFCDFQLICDRDTFIFKIKF